MKTNTKKMISLMSALAVCASYGAIIPAQAASKDDNASSITAEFTAVTKSDVTFKTSDGSALTSAEVYASLENAMKGTNAIMQATLSDIDGDGNNDTISYPSAIGAADSFTWGNDYYLRLATSTEADKYIYKKIKYNKIQSADFENMTTGGHTLDDVFDENGKRVFEKTNVNEFGFFQDRCSPTISLRNSYQDSYYILTQTKGVKNPIVEYEAYIAQIQPRYEGSENKKWNDLMGFVIGYNDGDIAKNITEAYKPGHPAYRNDWADHPEYTMGWTTTNIGYVEAGLNDDGTMIIGARKDGTNNDQTVFVKTAKKDVAFDLDVSANVPGNPQIFKNFVFEMAQNDKNVMVRATQKKDGGNLSETLIKDMTGLKVKDGGYITICGSTFDAYNGIAVDNILIYNYEDLQTELDEEYRIATSDDAQSSEIEAIISGNSKEVNFTLKVPAMVKSVSVVDLAGTVITSATVERENNSRSVKAVFTEPETIEFDKAYKLKATFVDNNESVSAQAFRLDKIFTEDFEGYNAGDTWSAAFTPAGEGGKDGTGEFYIISSQSAAVASGTDNKYLSLNAQYPLVISDESCKNLGNDFIVEADIEVDKFYSRSGDNEPRYGMVGFGIGTPKFRDFQHPGYVDLTLSGGQYWCSAVGVVNMGIRQNDAEDNDSEKGSLEINYWKNTDTVNALTTFANIKEFDKDANYGLENTKVKDNWAAGQAYNMIGQKSGGTYSLQVRNGSECFSAATSAADILYNVPESAKIAIYAHSSTTKVDNIKVYRFKVLDSVLEWKPVLDGNTVSVNVTSFGQTADTAKVIVAWYTDKDEMVDCAIKDVNLNTISTIKPVTVPDGNKVIVYIWNNMNDIKPLLPCEQLR